MLYTVNTFAGAIPPSSCSNSCTVGFRKATLQGKPSCCYDCIPCLQGEISNQTDSIICFRCPWDQWPNPEKSKCLQKPLEFLSYEDVLGTTLATISIISSIFPLLILWFFFHKKNTPLVKASNYSLSCLLLISLCLCFLCSLGFIGYPDHDKCLLRQVSFGLVFTLCVACILAKTIMVVFAFMATRPGSSLTNWIKFKASYSLITICCLLQLILCITWLSTAPPFAQYNTNITPEIVIVDCNEGSPIAFWTMLGFLFLLATISFIVAFLARRLPDSFNEAQFITFSMLAFISVWISYIPASLSAQGKYTVAMEIFAILASSWALLICMFLPKCVFILFRPGMNSRENIMKKNIDSRIYIFNNIFQNPLLLDEEMGGTSQISDLTVCTALCQITDLTCSAAGFTVPALSRLCEATSLPAGPGSAAILDPGLEGAGREISPRCYLKKEKKTSYYTHPGAVPLLVRAEQSTPAPEPWLKIRRGRHGKKIGGAAADRRHPSDLTSSGTAPGSPKIQIQKRYPNSIGSIRKPDIIVITIEIVHKLWYGRYITLPNDEGVIYVSAIPQDVIHIRIPDRKDKFHLPE
ncbi:unnamed protein product [Ranitomeya imitator]|uniref:G-protein coupled receptors family 3 profile domain-containing protein n=1 Tax=Ranitomeya imitator TaxID=111125 RepID=A0ABN9MK06_9NEOB|nr:unnamed protein product [Ranitomeya imitator]